MSFDAPARSDGRVPDGASMHVGVGSSEIAACMLGAAGLGRVVLLEEDGTGGGLSVVGAWPVAPTPARVDAEPLLLEALRTGEAVTATGGEVSAGLAPLCLGAAASMAVAVRAAGKVVLGLRSDPSPPADAEIRLFRASALLLVRAAAGERVGYEDPQARADRIADLVDAGLALAGETSLDGLLERITLAAREVLGARYAALGVLDEHGTALARFITSGVDEETATAIGPPPRGRGILGVVIQERRVIRLEHLSDDPRAVGFPANHPSMDSFLGVPIALRDAVYGNLYVTDKIDGSFTDEDERLARTLAAQAALAIDNARRYESERLRAEELETALEVGRAMLSVLDLDELLPLIARRGRRLAGADTVAVGIRDGDEIEFRYGHGATALALEGLRVAADLGDLDESLRRTAEGEWEVVPLVIDSETAGVLVAVRGGRFDDGARRLLRLLSTQAAIALANARAYTEERERLLTSAAVQAARAQEQAAAEGYRRAIEAQEAERARIARELHDEAGQVLTGLNLHLRAIEDREQDPEVRSSLSELRASVGAVSASLRELITELRPSGLREHGLAGAIERQAERVREAAGITIDVAVDHLPDLPHEVELVVFRVVQEALTNVARHSGASHASVVASAHGGRLRLVVEDDGRGFDATQPTRRLGLAGIRERCELLGGSLRIDSSPGAGTALTVDLDLNGREEAR